MPQTRYVKDVIFGGDARNNPPDYSWDTYVNYPGLDLTKQYIRRNVIIPDEFSVLEVTGLLQLDRYGNPMEGPNDLVFCPCPPYC